MTTVTDRLRGEIERILFAYDLLPDSDDTIIIASARLDDLTAELAHGVTRILERGIHEQLK